MSKNQRINGRSIEMLFCYWYSIQILRLPFLRINKRERGREYTHTHISFSIYLLSVVAPPPLRSPLLLPFFSFLFTLVIIIITDCRLQVANLPLKI